MLNALVTASVITDEWNGIQRDSVGTQLINAAILLIIAAAFHVLEGKTDSLFFRILYYATGAAGLFVIYHALFT
jgi:hypothetical protein